MNTIPIYTDVSPFVLLTGFTINANYLSLFFSVRYVLKNEFIRFIL